MKTFIRATEVWVLNGDGSALELGSAHYGQMDSFRQISEASRFAYDQGLPGKAWALRHPVILKHLQNSYFLRGDAAAEWGLTCSIALPIFSGDFLIAVVVFFCGDDEAHVGAIEIWHNDAAVGPDMGLHDGYYGTADLFSWRSKHTLFRKGTGLPGKAWSDNAPYFLANLVDADRFLRHEGTHRVGLNKGLALPFLQDPQRAYIVTLLSARGTPIARRFEIWRNDPNNPERLIYETGDCDIQPTFHEAYAELGIHRSDGVPGRVWLSGIPVVGALQKESASIAELTALRDGLETIVAIPHIHNGKLNRLVCWYF